MVYEASAAGKTCMAHAQATQGIKNAVVAGVKVLSAPANAIDVMYMNVTTGPTADPNVRKAIMW